LNQPNPAPLPLCSSVPSVVSKLSHTMNHKVIILTMKLPLRSLKAQNADCAPSVECADCMRTRRKFQTGFTGWTGFECWFVSSCPSCSSRPLCLRSVLILGILPARLLECAERIHSLCLERPV
jgi:hypothetical protein